MEVKPYIMKKSASLRITADICFYFSVLSMFPAFKSFQLSFAVFTALVKNIKARKVENVVGLEALDGD